MSSNTETWRRKSRDLALAEAVELELPSGTVIKARRPGPALLAGYGRLPFGLAGAASSTSWTGVTPQQAEDVHATADFLRDLLLYCVVDPSISLHPAAGEIHPREIADADVKYIFAWAVRGDEVASLETFRPGRTDEGSSGNGQTVPGTSFGSAGNRRQGRSSKLRSRGDGGVGGNES